MIDFTNAIEEFYNYKGSEKKKTLIYKWKKINYMSYIKSMENSEVNSAIERVFEKIDINKINSFIDNINVISDKRKNFYKYIINERYKILESVFNKIKEW